MSASSVTRDFALNSAAALPHESGVRFSAERPQDRARVDALIDHAFGPGRFAKTAERLREGSVAHPEFSLCAWEAATLAGAVRLWPVRIGDRRVIFLGPIAVEQDFRRHGLGAALVDKACTRALSAGESVVILVGDLDFFGPLGFEPVPAGEVLPPGPVAPHRLLWRALTPGATHGLAGRLAPLPPA